ncbi:hypothetical protein AaE_015926 [Aphanomyces astaci]|uniref:Tc1-like transposase DDE domain-containing protein n=1 Tax=Aphanomyces astaci TaxID=112090 RepID=A0A6A4YY38_APHAT|nr:hypothetical protein AaE_015926 [Aphanomyces astaci]
MCQATQQVHTTDRRTVVYLDESFINQHYNKNDISLYDDLDVQVKAIHKGRRFRFIAAIVDGGPFESFVVCYEKFFGGKQTKDYHGMVDHKYFVARFGRLLDDLADRGISNTIIVMDNAKYHKCIPDATPRFSWRKADLMVACDALGIEHTPGELKASIWSKLQPYTASVVPVVVEMASAAGHEVVYSAPHHSNLQPIELLWAIVKEDVGRQYDTILYQYDVARCRDALGLGVRCRHFSNGPRLHQEVGAGPLGATSSH